MEDQFYYYKRSFTLKDGRKSYYLNRVVKRSATSKRGRPKSRKTKIKEVLETKSEEDLSELYNSLKDKLLEYRGARGKMPGKLTLLIRYYDANPSEMKV